jgi:hypothetical protein
MTDQDFEYRITEALVDYACSLSPTERDRFVQAVQRFNALPYKDAREVLSTIFRHQLIIEHLFDGMQDET